MFRINFLIVTLGLELVFVIAIILANSSVHIQAECAKPKPALCKNSTQIQNKDRIYQDMINNCSNCLNQSGFFSLKLRNYTSWDWDWECLENENQTDFSNSTIIIGRDKNEIEIDPETDQDFDDYQLIDSFNKTHRFTLMCQESFKRNNMTMHNISRTIRRKRKNEVTMGNVLLFLSGVSIGISALFILLCFCQKKIKENWKAPRRDLL